MQEKSKVYRIKIDMDRANQRIDNFLMREMKGVPKSHIYRILRKGEVRVNKKRIKPEYKVQLGDEIRIPPMRTAQSTPVPRPSQQLQNLLENRILHEDDSLLIINKPADLAVHGGSGIDLGLIETLRYMRPKDKNLELVHRLDRETSGCLVLSKKPGVLKEIHELLREGKVEKTYLALVKGYWPKTMHQVDVPLRKFQLQSGERMVKVDEDEGKPSLTHFQVIQRFDDVTLIEAKPHTGRTHQIRVHALFAGHPIVGDEKYGDKELNKKYRELAGKRLFLHASRIEFILDEKKIVAEADLDLVFKNCLDVLK